MFDETYDVVVVGFGAAGTAAAVTARDAGASVVLVEKNPEHRHTPSTRMSGGMVMTVTDVDGGARYLDAGASGMVPFDVSHAWAERAAGLPKWFEEAIGGLDMVASAGAEHPGFEGAEAIVAVQPGGVAERLAAAAGGVPGCSRGWRPRWPGGTSRFCGDTAASRLIQGRRRAGDRSDRDQQRADRHPGRSSAAWCWPAAATSSTKTSSGAICGPTRCTSTATPATPATECAWPRGPERPCGI